MVSCAEFGLQLYDFGLDNLRSKYSRKTFRASYIIARKNMPMHAPTIPGNRNIHALDGIK